MSIHITSKVAIDVIHILRDSSRVSFLYKHVHIYTHIYTYTCRYIYIYISICCTNRYALQSLFCTRIYTGCESDPLIPLNSSEPQRASDSSEFL